MIWPVLVWIAHARRVRLLNLIAVLGVGSFALNVFISAHHPVEAFYFPYTRFWEFLIGALLALAYLRKREMPNGCTAEAVSLAGLGLIVGSVFALSRTLNFPGWWALLPATGAGLVISAGPASSLNKRLLSTPLLVWVGLIIYPLYL